MFYQLGKSQQSADNRFGALFISLSAIVMGSVSTIPELYSQRRVFYQERRAGYFRSIVWQLSLVLTELPICAIEMACYSTLLYGLCGLRGGLLSLPFLYFYLSMCAMNVICWSVAATSVMLTDSVVAAQALVPVYNAANILFSGYLMSKKDIPSYLQWLMVTSTVTRPFVGIAINEMETQIFDCKDEERVPFLNDPLLNVTAPIGFNNGHYRACPIQTGEDALKYLYGLDADDYNVWHLLLFSVGYFLLFQILLSITIAFIDHSTTVSDDPASKMVQSGEQGQRGVHVVQQDENDESNFSGVGTELRFRNISYTINIGKGSGSESTKKILTSVSGLASPGSVRKPILSY